MESRCAWSAGRALASARSVAGGGSVGTYVKSFVVDGEEYELYAQVGNGLTTYDLFDRAGLIIIIADLTEVPDEETVVALVRVADGWGDDAA